MGLLRHRRIFTAIALVVAQGASASQPIDFIGMAATSVQLPPVTVTVVKVKDGDTVQVQEFSRDIRLASIDAPELGHGKARPGQPFAQNSRGQLLDLIGKAHEITAVCYERDRYDRNVCDLYADKVSISRAMVASGMAWANLASHGRYLRDASLPGLEREARGRHLGLWQENGPQAPWEWRSQCWESKSCIQPE